MLGVIASLLLSTIPLPNIDDIDPAVRIALNHPVVKEALSDDNMTYTVIDRPDNREGYLNYTGDLKEIVLMIHDKKGAGLEAQFAVLLVDVKAERSLSMFNYGHIPPPYFIEAIIPPGTYWYFANPGDYSSGGRAIRFDLLTTLKPDGSMIYPIILNVSNFTKLKNEEPFVAIPYYDYFSNGSVLYDGSVPVGSPWNTSVNKYRELNISSGDITPDMHEDMRKSIPYIVFYNPPGSKEVTVSMWIW